MDLVEQVLHNIDGEQVHVDRWHLAGGLIEDRERRSYGPDRWVEHVVECRDLTACECLSIVLFVVRDQFNIHRTGRVEEREIKIIESWGGALLEAANKGTIIPRDVDTLLPVSTPVTGWDWRLSLKDADAWVASKGMEWTCAEIVTHLYSEVVGTQVLPMPALESGEIANSEDGPEQEGALKGTTAERRMQCIRLAVAAKGWDPVNIDDGGKAEVGALCLKTLPELFTKSTFPKAWQAAVSAGYIRMKKHETYAKR